MPHMHFTQIGLKNSCLSILVITNPPPPLVLGFIWNQNALAASVLGDTPSVLHFWKTYYQEKVILGSKIAVFLQKIANNNFTAHIFLDLSFMLCVYKLEGASNQNEFIFV